MSNLYFLILQLELQTALNKWVIDYNADYPHSSLNYKTPCEFERICPEKFSKFFVD
jgi:transposase InsO family protein